MTTQFRIAIMALAFPALTFMNGMRAKAQGSGPVRDGITRLERFAQYRIMADTSAFRDVKWQFLGPVNISGRCTDVAVVAPKGDNYTVYVASASGGVWKSVNEGTSWEAVFDREATASIGDIALDPENAETVWVGTGEANIFRSSMAGAGIYKSTDGGATWKQMGLKNTYTIARIVVDPENSDVVYVASPGHEWTDSPDRGVYKTTDGGKTWKKILYVDSRTGAIDLVIDPTDPNILYAATWQRIRLKWNDPRNEPGYTGSGIWKTIDGGAHWTRANNGLPEAKYRGRIGIDLCRSKPSVIYAFLDDYEVARDEEYGETDPYGRPRGKVIKGATVYRSDDGAGNWTLVSGQTKEMKEYMEHHSATYGWVFGQIRVDPVDENTIYTMGLNLNVSTDGGRTFKQLRGMHGDHHGLWIDPDNTGYLMNVNDGGISVSYDKGRHWRSFTDNLPLAQFFNVMYDMDDPFRVYGSVQDHGSYRAQVDLSRGRDGIRPVDFERAPGGEGTSHAIDPDDPDIVYSSTYYGRITRTRMTNRWWTNVKETLPKTYPDEPPLRGQWVAPTILSPYNPAIVYHGMQCVLKSTDEGRTWERISGDLSHNDPRKMGDISYQVVSSIAESPLKQGLLYAGTDDGRLHRTRNGGKTWTEITRGLVAGKWVSRVEASAYDMGRVYVAQNGKRDDDFAAYLWMSDDFGDTWTNITGNIPIGPVNVIREDPVDGNILYAGTDAGVFVSKDRGGHWSVLGDLPTVYVHDLVIHPRDNIIVIATHGRGLWVMDANLVNGGSRSGFYYGGNAPGF